MIISNHQAGFTCRIRESVNFFSNTDSSNGSWIRNLALLLGVACKFDIAFYYIFKRIYAL